MKRELRTIITINKEACNGCGLCVDACHEGALALVEGKAKLMHEYYCDGLGACLPVCPQDALSFEQRLAEAFDEEAVLTAQAAKQEEIDQADKRGSSATQLKQWPVQIRLVPSNMPYFDNADLLIAADCTAFAYGNFHEDFMKGKVTLIGCPKLDDFDYRTKLAEIIVNNNIASVEVVRMEVPCCGGIENAIKMAVSDSGKDISVNVVTLSVVGEIC